MRLSAESVEIEHAIHDETNRRRVDHGLDRLTYSDHLSIIAARHSRDMAQRDFFAHANPDGDEPSDRYKTFGHDTRSSGENIALEHYDVLATPEKVAQSVVDAWMNSQGHRENILRDHFTEEGIGVYLNHDGGVYATQNFY
nr:CAP domain-containing protein [Halosimplex pelagicum]